MGLSGLWATGFPSRRPVVLTGHMCGDHWIRTPVGTPWMWNVLLETPGAKRAPRANVIERAELVSATANNVALTRFSPYMG